MDIVALTLSAISLVIASVAYWRSGGARDIARLRAELTESANELRARIRTGYEESLARIDRARARLGEIPPHVATSLRASIDTLNQELSRLRQEAQEELERLKTSASSSARAAEQALAMRVRRLEGRVHLFIARAEKVRAEGLAKRGEFASAEDILEEAITRVREAQTELAGMGGEEPSFAHLVGALRQAVRSVRSRAETHKRELEEVIAESDGLLRSLEAEDARAHVH
jgi:chromosome segregation ATPase